MQELIYEFNRETLIYSVNKKLKDGWKIVIGAQYFGTLDNSSELVFSTVLAKDVQNMIIAENIQDFVDIVNTHMKQGWELVPNTLYIKDMYHGEFDNRDLIDIFITTIWI